jgi:NADPH:quinone reductase-like Zn-dependent oxidoreductase
MQIPEAYIIKKPSEVSYELAAAGVATGVKVLTALHYNLGVLEGESLLIINSMD